MPEQKKQQSAPANQPGDDDEGMAFDKVMERKKTDATGKRRTTKRRTTKKKVSNAADPNADANDANSKMRRRISKEV